MGEPLVQHLPAALDDDGRVGTVTLQLRIQRPVGSIAHALEDRARHAIHGTNFCHGTGFPIRCQGRKTRSHILDVVGGDSDVTADDQPIVERERRR